jgi:translation elongation factor EF-Tu-like GTPase
MANKPKGNALTRDEALAVIMTHAESLPTSAAIADALTVSGKTVRGRVRAGTLKTEDGTALAGVRVSKDGQTALTNAHKRAIAFTFAPSDDAACVALAERLTQ